MPACHCVHSKPAGPPDEGADPPPKPLMINFTSAQQNCMRARGRASNGGGGGWGGGMGYREHHQPYERQMDNQRGYRPWPGNRGRGGDGGRGDGGAVPSKSRALYFGSLPDSAGLTELVALVEVRSPLPAPPRTPRARGGTSRLTCAAAAARRSRSA